MCVQFVGMLLLAWFFIGIKSWQHQFVVFRTENPIWIGLF